MAEKFRPRFDLCYTAQSRIKTTPRPAWGGALYLLFLVHAHFFNPHPYHLVTNGKFLVSKRPAVERAMDALVGTAATPAQKALVVSRVCFRTMLWILLFQ